MLFFTGHPVSLYAWLWVSLFPQVDCVHQDHQIRSKTQADGSIPCPGEIGVFLFDKIKPCESALNNYLIIKFI